MTPHELARAVATKRLSAARPRLEQAFRAVEREDWIEADNLLRFVAIQTDAARAAVDQAKGE